MILTAGAMYPVLRLLGASWRIKFPQRRELENSVTQGEKPLLVFWHGEYLPLFIALRGLAGCVFTSESFRGRIIQRLCTRFGFACEILTGDQEQRQTQLLQAANRYPAIALAIDGPLGPFHVIKAGAIRTARITRHPIIPMVCRGRRQWISRKRWDRFAVPKPFTTVVVALGKPVTVAPENTTKQYDEAAATLARGFEHLNGKVKALLLAAKINRPTVSPH